MELELKSPGLIQDQPIPVNIHPDLPSMLYMN